MYFKIINFYFSFKGIPYKFENGTETYLLMNGILRCSLVWGVSETGDILVPDDIETSLK